MISRMTKYLVALSLTFLGCRSGIDTALLNTPNGVVNEPSAGAQGNNALYARALQKAVQSSKSSGTQDPSLLKTTNKALEISEFGVLRKLISAPALKAAITSVSALESSSAIADHVKIVSELTALLAANGLGAKTIAELKSLNEADSSKLAAGLDKALRIRLKQEVLHLWCPTLKTVADAAATASTLSTLPQAVAIEIRFLRTGLNCVEYSTSLVSAYHRSLSEVLAVLGRPKPSKISADDWTKLAIIFNTIKSSEPYLQILQKASSELNPITSPYLSQVLSPLPFGATDIITQTPVEQISTLISQGKSAITFTAADQRELDIYANYFVFTGQDVRLIDLFTLRENAHSLQIPAAHFVTWSAEIINKLSNANAPKPIVILQNLGALNYDSSINERSAQQIAMGRNFDELLSKTQGVTILAPVLKDNLDLFINSESARRTRLELNPIQLPIAKKVIEDVVEQHNTTSQKPASGSLSLKIVSDPNAKDEESAPNETSLSAIPLEMMARAYRALKPNQFSLGKVLAMNDQFLQQRALAKSALTPTQERDLALKIVQEALNIDQRVIEESHVLTLDSSAIENQLAQKPDAFNQGINRKELLESQSEIDARLLRVQDIYNKINVVRLETKDLIKGAEDTLNPFKNLGELRDDIDKKIAVKADNTALGDLQKILEAQIAIATKGGVTQAELKAVKDALDKLPKDGVTQAELKAVKDALDKLPKDGITLDQLKTLQDALAKLTSEGAATKDELKAVKDAWDKLPKDAVTPEQLKTLQDALAKLTSEGATKEELKAVSDALNKLPKDAVTPDQLKTLQDALAKLTSEGATKEELKLVSDALNKLPKDAVTPDQLKALQDALAKLTSEGATKEELKLVSDALNKLPKDAVTPDQLKPLQDALAKLTTEGATKEELKAVSDALNKLPKDALTPDQLKPLQDALAKLTTEGATKEELKAVSDALNKLPKDALTPDQLKPLQDALAKLTTEGATKEELKAVSDALNKLPKDAVTPDQLKPLQDALAKLTTEGATKEELKAVSDALNKLPKDALTPDQLKPLQDALAKLTSEGSTKEELKAVKDALDKLPKDIVTPDQLKPLQDALAKLTSEGATKDELKAVGTAINKETDERKSADSLLAQRITDEIKSAQDAISELEKALRIIIDKAVEEIKEIKTKFINEDKLREKVAKVEEEVVKKLTEGIQKNIDKIDATLRTTSSELRGFIEQQDNKIDNKINEVTGRISVIQSIIREMLNSNAKTLGKTFEDDVIKAQKLFD